jgi:hypothetical protein
MFKRVILESWHESIPYICFSLIAGAFLIIVIRALLMRQSEVERISRLPLTDDHEGENTENNQSSK